MNKDQIKVGGEYQAKVGQKMTTVKVLRISDLADVPPKGVNKGIMYYCLNLTTNRECKFRGATGFSPTIASLFKSAEVGTTSEYAGIPEPIPTYVDKENETEPNPPGSFALLYGNPAPTPSEKPTGMGAKMAKTQAPVTVPHIRLRALAGCGKTTTLTEGLKELRGYPVKITPSPQQRAVWDSIKLSENPSTICLVSFGNAIVDELIERIKPIEHTGVEAKTLHKLGGAAIRKSFELLPGRDSINGFRVDNLLGAIIGRDLREVKKFQPELVPAVKELVKLCKVNLRGLKPTGGVMDNDYDWDSCLEDLTHYYDIDLGNHRSQIFDLVPKVLRRCLDIEKDKYIDFDDMPWLPIALNLPVYQYDLLLVDEAQDLNPCQHALCMKAGKRILFCGDEHQAIYGFTGADCDSMDSLYDHLSHTAQTCITLMLNVTRRCGKAIVGEAQKFVPEFEAHASNPEGKVSYAVYKHADPNKSYHHLVEDGDMCVCRVNAPLVSQCFRFLKEGRKAYIQGRDIGTGLIKLIDKLMKDYIPLAEEDEPEMTLAGEKCHEILYLEDRLDEWKELEIQAENRKKNVSEPRIIAIQDKHLCLVTFLDGVDSVSEMRQKILDIFTDDTRDGIRLSSVHKSKGLEANRVFILMPKGAEMPHPMARTAWAKKQELNLKYVAVTRAIHELIYVTEDK